MKEQLLHVIQEHTSESVNGLRKIRNAHDLSTGAMERAVTLLTDLKRSAMEAFPAADTLTPDAALLKEDLHAAAGNAIAASRLMLEAQASVTEEEVFGTWDHLLTLIETGVHTAALPDAAASLFQAAEAAGIRLTLASDLPTDELQLRAYMKGAALRLLDASRAGKTTLTL